MRVLATPQAAELLELRKSWWRANRPATAELFDQEFLEVAALIGDKPDLFPVFLRAGERKIRRILMEKAACHLYYEIDEAAGVVRIVSAWGAVQGKPPTI